MGRYHISGSGEPALCSATVRECPLGADAPHGEFESMEAARAWSEDVLAKQNGGTVNKLSRGSGIRQPRLKPEAYSEQLSEKYLAQSSQEPAELAAAFGVEEHNVFKLNNSGQTIVVVRDGEVHFNDNVSAVFRPATDSQLRALYKSDPSAKSAFRKALPEKWEELERGNARKEVNGTHYMEYKEEYDLVMPEHLVVERVIDDPVEHDAPASSKSISEPYGAADYNKFIENIVNSPTGKSPELLINTVRMERAWYVNQLAAAVVYKRTQRLNSLDVPKRRLFGLRDPHPEHVELYENEVNFTNRRFAAADKLIEDFKNSPPLTKLPELLEM